MSVGSFAFVSQAFGADPLPADAAKAVERAADKTVDAAKDTKAAADQLTKSTVALVPAPAADDIRNTLALTTEAAVTKGGFNDVVKHLVDADRTRAGSYTNSEESAKLDGRIDQFRKDWKSKYGQDFGFSKNAHDVLGDSFARISQGEIGEARTAAGKDIASNEPKVTAGTAEDLQKSGVAKTDANSEKMGGGDTNKDMGRNIASVVVLASPGMPQMAVPVIHELPNSWQIDLPDSIDGQKLHANLLKHVTMIDEDRANWPADVNDGYRAVTRHILTAMMESDAHAPLRN